MRTQYSRRKTSRLSHTIDGSKKPYLVLMLVGAIFAGVGGLLMILAWSEYNTNSQLQADGVEARADVIEIDRVTQQRDGRIEVKWDVTYQFRDNTGRLYTDTNRYTKSESVPNQGDMIMITYLPSDPNTNLPTAALESNTFYFFIIIFTGAFVVVGVGLLLGGIFLASKQHLKDSNTIAKDELVGDQPWIP